MSYGLLPEPGGEFLCAGPCEHTDCAACRRLLTESCRLCGSQMQPLDRYQQDELNSDRIVHWACSLAQSPSPYQEAGEDD